jgi:phosphatidylglycerophosphate synthase
MRPHEATGEDDAAGPVRRPIPARETRWAAVLAGWLARVGVRPNLVSVLSVVFAVLAGASLVAGSSSSTGRQIVLLITAGVCIQLRLLCNMLDGMLAIEQGFQTKSGLVFNELPDRISDAVILVCAGYAVRDWSLGPAMGWSAALLAVMTAYMRLLGGLAGVPQDFGGPMAKQQRMNVLTAACAVAAAVAGRRWSDEVLAAALVLIVVGSAVTLARRALRVVKELEAR